MLKSSYYCIIDQYSTAEMQMWHDSRCLAHSLVCLTWNDTGNIIDVRMSDVFWDNAINSSQLYSNRTIINLYAHYVWAEKYLFLNFF